MLSLTFCYNVCVFSVLFSIFITSLGEERAGIYASHAFVCSSCMRCFLVLVSSSCCRGSVTDCDCGTSWTFHLFFVK